MSGSGGVYLILDKTEVGKSGSQLDLHSKSLPQKTKNKQTKKPKKTKPPKSYKTKPKNQILTDFLLTVTCGLTESSSG